MRLEVKDICKSFEERKVLHNVSFSLESGRALGLLGRNGAGKTTTIRILMDVFKANSGELLLDGKEFKAKNYHIGYMPEERGMYPKLKVIDQLVYFGELRGLSKKEALNNAESLLEELSVSEYRNRILQTLSKGNQQKIQLAQTLITNPDVIILDEPFSGLDPVNSQILKNVIKKRIDENKLVIFSSHQMSYVEEFCDDIVIIKDGKVVLSGDLNKIKQVMGAGRISLSVNGMNSEQLNAYLMNHASNLLDEIEVKKDYIVARLIKDKNSILNQLCNDGLDIEYFGDYRPSLNDIFVKEAGDLDEAV